MSCIPGEGGDCGLLGHGDKQHQYTPKRVENLVGVRLKQSACGGAHTAVCSESGEVYTFGKGECRQLGHGDMEIWRYGECSPSNTR